MPQESPPVLENEPEPPATTQDTPMDTRINHTQSPTLAAKSALAVTPHDVNTLICHSGRGLYVGVSGDITVDMVAGGSGILFKNVPVGKLDIIVSKVYATGTTATNILALF